jgi:hypothetical protein
VLPIYLIYIQIDNKRRKVFYEKTSRSQIQLLRRKRFSWYIKKWTYIGFHSFLNVHCHSWKFYCYLAHICNWISLILCCQLYLANSTVSSRRSRMWEMSVTILIPSLLRMRFGMFYFYMKYENHFSQQKYSIFKLISSEDEVKVASLNLISMLNISHFPHLRLPG